jgi:C-terminal processing protease CtpA/Prc
MRRILVIVLALVVLVASSYVARILMSNDPIGHLPHWIQVRPSIYLDTALERIEQGSYGRATVDWPTVRRHAKDLAAPATTADETYGAIRYVLGQLPDHVSLLTPPPASTSGRSYGLQVLFPERVVAIVYPDSAAAAAGIHVGDVIESVEGHPPMVNRDPRARGNFIDIPPTSSTVHVRPVTGASRDVPLAVASYSLLPADTHRIGGDLGYVLLPGTSGAASFVQAVRHGIATADAPNVCGWIVDLRRNTGGAMWPMFQAIRAIVGEPPFGSFVDSSGARTAWVYPTAGDGSASGTVTALSHPHGPMAVLTSRLTAGAAEAIVISFRGRPETRSFGEPTWGTPTSSHFYSLADGALLQLTAAFAADRMGVEYRSRIAPDEAMPVDWARLGTAADPMIVAAGTWIRAQEACRR